VPLGHPLFDLTDFTISKIDVVAQQDIDIRTFHFVVLIFSIKIEIDSFRRISIVPMTYFLNSNIYLVFLT